MEQQNSRETLATTLGVLREALKFFGPNGEFWTVGRRFTGHLASDAGRGCALGGVGAGCKALKLPGYGAHVFNGYVDKDRMAFTPTELDDAFGLLATRRLYRRIPKGFVYSSLDSEYTTTDSYEHLSAFVATFNNTRQSFGEVREWFLAAIGDVEQDLRDLDMKDAEEAAKAASMLPTEGMPSPEAEAIGVA